MSARVNILIGIALGAALMLSGCGTFSTSLVAQVPTAGPISQGEQVDTNREDQFIRVIARGPRDGMSPTEIVQGFLDASASFDGDHAVARQFLTRRANRTWDTAAGVTIYEGVSTLGAFGSTVTLRASKNGSISSIGRYDVAAAGDELRSAYRLVREGEEWRIDQLPQGLVLSLPDVDRSFRSLSIYFFDPAFRTLVPDPRMIPVLGPGQATTLVRYLIGGPSAWLEPAVRTGFPAGVSLNIDAVPVEGGIARVDLTANARNADDSARRALSQQLVWTLKQVPDVVSVDLTSAGLPLSVPGIASPQPRDAWPSVDPGALPAASTAYLARPGLVARLVGDLVVPVPGGAGSAERTFSRLAISQDSTKVAGIDGKRRLWEAAIAPGSPLTQIELETPVANPVFDHNGDLWGIDPELGVVRIAAGGAVRSVPVTGLPAGSQVTMAVPSRDGTRVALIVASGPRNLLLLGRIVRTSPNGEVTISSPIRVESSLAEVIDVSWSDADRLAVLGSVETGSLQVFEVGLARGTVTALGSPEAPISVAAAPGLPMLVGAADGQVYALGSGSWQPRARGTSPTYPN